MALLRTWLIRQIGTVGFAALLLLARPAGAQAPATAPTFTPPSAPSATLTTSPLAAVEKDAEVRSDSGLFFASDREMLFAAVVVFPPPMYPGIPIQSVVFGRRATSNQWTLLADLQGRITSMTIWHGQPAAVLSSGTWRSIYEANSTLGLPAPGGTPIVRLAGAGDTLVALTRRRNGEFRLLRLDSAPSGWVDVGPAPVKADQPLDLLAIPDMGATRVYLVTTGPVDGDGARSVQVSLARVPLQIPTTRPATRSAATSASTPQISSATRTASSLQASLTRPTLHLEPVTWETVAQFVPVEKTISQLRLLDVTDSPAPPPVPAPPAVWVDPGQTSAGGAYVLATNSAAPRRIDLGAFPGELGYSGSRLRMFYVTEKDDEKATGYMYEQVYDVPSGQPLGEPTKFRFPTLAAPDALQSFVSIAALVGLLLGMWRVMRLRSEFTPELLRAATALPLAPRTIRVAADAIDALPWLGTLIYLAFTGQISFFTGATDPQSLIFLLLAVAVVTTHTLITELLFGRSLGKALLGLQVTALNGKRALPREILLRNLLKIVEMLFFAAPYLTLLFSPLRQSFADSASGTLVTWVPPGAPKE